jgi:apolipoprotein N-acyltransferase
VGLVQGNFEQSLKWQVPVSDAVTRYVELTKDLVKNTRPDLIVWPEVAVPAVLSEDPGLLGYLEKYAAAWRTPLYFGTMDRDMRTDGENGPLYNSAVFLDPARISGLPEPTEQRLVSYRLRGTEVDIPRSSVLPAVVASPRTSDLVVYDKARLLQFGEYVPFNYLIPFIQRYVETRGGGAYSMGTIGRVLATRFGDLGTLICSESTFSGLARRSVLNGAVLLVNMTNDAWYKKTAAPRQHALQSQFRAIETGRAVVRVANTGWTRVYLPDGSVLGEIPWFTTEAEAVEVPLYSHLTFQTRVGDFLGWLCLVCLGLSLLISRERVPEEVGETEEEESLAESAESG